MKLKKFLLRQKISKPLNQTFFKSIRPKISHLGPFLFLFFTSLIQANNSTTTFRWIQDDDNPAKGKCYEYDLETGGQQYQVKVGKSKCLPKDSIYVWVADESGIGGRCYQVDKETRGDKYSSSTSKRKCLEKIQNFQFVQTEDLKGECYRIISETNRQKISTEKCRPENITFHWLPSKSGWGGRCYEIDEELGPSSYIKKSSTENCRSENVTFSLQLNSRSPEGICYEVDSENGPKAYSNKVRREKCINKTEQVSYSWIRTSEISGKCFKLETSFQGEVTRSPTTYKNCIDFETSLRFIKSSPVKGVCVLEDSKSSGEQFRVKVQMNKCKLLSGVTDHQFITPPGKSLSCYEMDAKTSGDHYIKKVELNKCNSKKLFPKWFADEDGWRGKCVHVLPSGKRYSKKVLDPEKCKAKRVKIMWHNFSKFVGGCFEIDSEKGPRYYSNEIESKKCKPKDLKYVFYREKDESSGICYSVDQETGGDKYFKKASSKKCKGQLKELPQTQEDSYHK